MTTAIFNTPPVIGTPLENQRVNVLITKTFAIRRAAECVRMRTKLDVLIDQLDHQLSERVLRHCCLFGPTSCVLDNVDLLTAYSQDIDHDRLFLTANLRKCFRQYEECETLHATCLTTIGNCDNQLEQLARTLY